MALNVRATFVFASMLLATSASACLAAGSASPAPAQPANAVADVAVNAWWDRYLDGAQLVALPDGRKIELYCEGRGAPVVILDAGLGNGAWRWRKVQVPLAAKTRVCAFSRAGYGRSSPAPAPRDAAARVDDLEAMLRAARIDGPYVMVGHSLASFDVRLFAFRHPRQVVGVVLVDPSADDMYDAFETRAPGFKALMDRLYADYAVCEADPRPKEAEAKCVDPAPPGTSARGQAYLAATRSPAAYRAIKAEMSALQTLDSPELITARRPLGAIPLIVLTAGKMTETPGLTSEQNAAISQWWTQSHDEMAALSTAGVNRTVPDTTHGIPDQKPEAVIGAVDEVVDRIRAGSR